MSVLKIKDSNNQWNAVNSWGDFYAQAFTITLSSSSWSNNVQTVSNSNFVITGYGYIVTPVSTAFAEYCESGIYADDITTGGQITFHCSAVPSSNLTVNIFKIKTS